jgi:plastocyanin
MIHRQLDRRTLLSVGAIGGVASALGLRPGLAQDATPTAGGEVAHPVHIHSGTCEELGDVVFPLNDLVPLDAAATPAASPAASPAAGGAGEVVAESTTEVEASFEELLASEAYAINAHESAENIGNYIACGNLTGPATDGEVRIELQELNDSGYTGEAHLVDNGDGTTTVTVTLRTTGDAAGTPAASGQSDTAAAVEVEIKDFTYNPDPVTIKVGESVTWTNLDTVPHTATGQDREVLQSGTLGKGESYTQAFDTAGTYEYFCEFHPNMKGVLNVE